MRYIIGPSDEYDSRLRSLFHFFVMARVLRDEPALGVLDGQDLTAVAMITPHGPRETPAALTEQTECLWRELGEAAQNRYEELGKIWKTFEVDVPNYYLGMIGVRSSRAGQGLWASSSRCCSRYVGPGSRFAGRDT